jgi:hypothetical protein
MNRRYDKFRDFYPYYLSQHQNQTCRRLHFVGTSVAIAAVCYAVTTWTWWVLWLCPIMGYLPAWIGHSIFERNRPATFEYPIYSLIGDFAMFKDILIGRIRF